MTSESKEVRVSSSLKLGSACSIFRYMPKSIIIYNTGLTACLKTKYIKRQVILAKIYIDLTYL